MALVLVDLCLSHGMSFFFVVLVDVGPLYGPPEWEPNSDPQPLDSALREAAELRQAHWRVKVMPG